MEIKVSLDFMGYGQKPKGKEIGIINKRIVKNQRQLEVKKLADQVGNRGKTFCPAIFSGGRRKAEDFLEMQLFVLDFDGGVSLEEIEARAKKHRLDIAFKYTTFSSTEENPKFRIAFLNDVPVTDKMAAEVMIKMLMGIFPEADKSCKDVSRMFFGGKGIIGEIREETIDIVRLMVEFQCSIFVGNTKNYARAIQQFAKENNIICDNNCLKICHIPEKNGQFEDFSVEAEYIHREFTKFPSNSPVYYIENGYKTNVRKIEAELPNFRVELSGLEKKCQLYSDFLRLPHITHNERFLLLTNMTYMNGGKKRFLEIIKKKQYDESNWRYYAKYVRDSRYKPQSCDNGCQYAETCSHKTNMLLTVKEKDRIIKKGQEQYHPIETVYGHIYSSLKGAVDSRQAGIYLIPAQTAVGKTEAYCKMIYECKNKRFIVAVPTNCLKREVEERLKGYGVEDILTTPSLDELDLPRDLEREAAFLYEMGLGRHVTQMLKRYIKKNRKSKDKSIQRAVYGCERYLCTGEELQKKRVVVTTHARLATLSDDMVKGCEVIIDEDILATFFKNIRAVSIPEVAKALKMENIPLILKGRLEEIMRAEENIYEKFTGNVCFEYIPRKEIERERLCGDVNSISIASTFLRTGDFVWYFYPQTIPQGKYIVLSATLNEPLYKMYFRGWPVKSVPYYKAAYKGKLIQLTAYSMSRQCIAGNKERILDFVNEKGREFGIITFLEYEKEFNSCGIHFGNAEGIDALKGKDLMIIGTPHQNEFVYKLIGCHLGIRVNGETLVVRKVESGGYEFKMMTYPEGALQDLQIYFIRRELEQCIGRARLLRNDCKVVVLSNFPCEQAELTQEDYLEMVNPGASEACGSGMAEKL